VPVASETRRLKVEVQRVFEENRSVYGADKVWTQLNRRAPRWLAAPLSASWAIWDCGACGRGRAWKRTTVGDDTQDRPADLVERRFVADRPSRLWVADLTYVKTHVGFVYVAFVLDVFSRFVVGWQVSTSLRSDLAIDRLGDGHPFAARAGGLEGLVHHSDRGVQYLSIRYTERLAEVGVVNSVGSRGDSYDNAWPKSFNGLYQDRADLPRRTVEGGRGCRVGHPDLRGLVQPPSHPQRDRQDSAGRVRGPTTTVRVQHEKQSLHRQLSL